jgi:hypothetical protein
MMSSVVRAVLGAALLLTGASAAMAASDGPPVTYQSVQTAAPPAATAANTAVAATNAAPAAVQPQKSSRTDISDKSDRYGGHDPNSTAGNRAFWEGVNPY